MFEKLLSFAVPNSLAQVLAYIFIGFVIYLFIRNKGKWQIGPISFEPTEDDKKFYGEFLEFTQKSEQGDKDILKQIKLSIKDRQQIHFHLQNISVEMKSQKDDLLNLRKESLKTQILLGATSYAQKLYLYDEYKKLGGNGWMEEWMEKYKEEHKDEL